MEGNARKNETIHRLLIFLAVVLGIALFLEFRSAGDKISRHLAGLAGEAGETGSEKKKGPRSVVTVYRPTAEWDARKEMEDIQRRMDIWFDHMLQTTPASPNAEGK